MIVFREELFVNKKTYNLIQLIIFGFLVAVTGIHCDMVDSAKETLPSPSSQGNKPPAVVDTNTAKPPSPIAEQPIAANVLARVGTWTITIEEFNERLKLLEEEAKKQDPQFNAISMEDKKQILEGLVRQQLLVAEAEQSGLANQKDIEEATNEFRRTLIAQEMIKNLVRDVNVSDEEAKAFYEERKDVLVEPVQWHVREIVVDSQLKANELSVQLLQGADFTEIAKQNSIGETAAQGGELGTISAAPFPEMESALIPLKPGEISGVFKGPKGYYVVKLEGKKGGEPVPFDTLKKEILDSQLIFKQQQVILDHIEKFKGQVKVEIKENLL